MEENLWDKQDDVNEEVKNNILSELKTDQENLAKDVASFREWICHQHHFPRVRVGDTLLESMLIGSKGSLDKAKLKLDAYFSCRSRFPDVFAKRDPLDADFLRFAKTQPLITLPGRTEDGYRVHVTWLEGSEYDVTAWTQRVVSQWEILLRTDPWSAGEIFLVSGNNFSFLHAAKLTPNQVSTIFSLAQNVYPLRIRGIWFFNAPPACDFIVNKVLKPVISKKLSERIQVFSDDHTVLLQHFPAELLPEDFGGEAPSLCLLNERCLEKLSRHREWFLEEGTLTTDEAMRPSATVDTFGGVAGSFRKLHID